MLRVILKYARWPVRDPRAAARLHAGPAAVRGRCSEIPRVRNGLGMAILSTSQGLMSDRSARARRTPAASCSPSSGKETPTCHVSASVRSRFRPGSRSRSTDSMMVGEGSQGGALAHVAPGHDREAGRRQMLTVTRPSDESDAQGAARPDAHAGRQHGRGCDRRASRSSSRSPASATRRKLKPYGLQLSLGLLAPDRVQGAGGHQAHRAECRRRWSWRARARNWSGRWPRRSAAAASPSRTRARACKYQGEVIRRKAGKAGGK